MNFVPARIKGLKLILPFGETQLPAKFNSSTHKQVIAAFRPESIGLATSNDEQADAVVFSTDVDFIEWLGAEQYAYFNVEEQELKDFRVHHPFFNKRALSLVSRLDPSTPLQQGEPLRLKLNANDIHLFDVETENNIA